MKFLFSILALLLTVKECDQKKSVKEQLVNTIEYTAISRGSFQEVIINDQTISIKKDRNSEPIIKSCTDEFWNDIMQTINSIDVESMNNLVAPTQKRLHDGAAHANIKITIDGKTYETQGFDHGFPPEEMKILSEKVLESTVSAKNSTSIIGTYDVVFMNELQGIDVSNRKVTINFNEKGQVYGYNGCNNYKADFSISEDKIEIGIMMTTRRYCEDALQVEGKLSKNLREADSLKLEEDMLLLYKGETNTIKAKRVLNKE